MNGLPLLLVLLAAGALGYWLARQRAAAPRAVVDELRQDLAAQREAGVTATIDTVVAVAGERFGRHTAEQRAQLGELRTDLERVRGLVQTLESGRAEQYGRLTDQIAQAGVATTTLAETTRQLREALSSTSARGQWGERMAEDVLQLAGFLEGVNYVRQQRIESGGVPDFTFMLPRGMRLHMDVKFPLSNYLRYLEAATAPDRDRLRRDFLRDARARVRELVARDYLDPERTVDCLLLFIPNEQLYAFIQEHDPDLTETALRGKVVLCSPLTLFAVLAVVRQAADNFRLERTSDEILRLLGQFQVQWQKFSEQLDAMGTHLERAQKAYEGLVSTRRRQLEKPLDKLEALRDERQTQEPPALPELRAVGK